MLFYNYDPVAQVNFLCSAAGKLLATPDEGSNKYLICDSNGVFESLGLIPEGLAGRYYVTEVIRESTDEGWSFVLGGETISYDDSELSVTVSKFEGALPVIGDVQVFKNEACSEYFNGQSNVCYVRLNEGLGRNGERYWNQGTSNNWLSLNAPSDEIPSDSYNVNAYVDWDSGELEGPLAEGAIVTCTAPESTTISDPKIIFE